MNNATVLYHIGVDTPDAEIRDAANRSAAAGNHLVVMLHDVMLSLPMSAYGAMPYSGPVIPDEWSASLAEKRKVLEQLQGSVETILAAENCSGEVRPVLASIGDIEDHVALSALTADLSVVSGSLRDLPELFDAVMHGIIFRSPAGVLLNGPVVLQAKNIMLAWDESLPAARAAHAALPMLKAAEQVTIACFDPRSSGHFEPGASVASWLSHHGCKVEVGQYPKMGEDVADSISHRASELGADLIVMGAYGHSRLRQAIFGGTTRQMIEQSNQSVFLSH